MNNKRGNLGRGPPAVFDPDLTCPGPFRPGSRQTHEVRATRFIVCFLFYFVCVGPPVSLSVFPGIALTFSDFYQAATGTERYTVQEVIGRVGEERSIV